VGRAAHHAPVDLIRAVVCMHCGARALGGGGGHAHLLVEPRLLPAAPLGAPCAGQAAVEAEPARLGEVGQVGLPAAVCALALMRTAFVACYKTSQHHDRTRRENIIVLTPPRNRPAATFQLEGVILRINVRELAPYP
jgi:hypothetical protein